MSMKKFFDSTPEVHSCFDLIPSVSFIRINNELDVRIRLAHRLAKSPSVIDRNPEILSPVREQQRLPDLAGVVYR